MKRIRTPRFFGLFLSFALLISPLPLPAMVESIQLSEFELSQINKAPEEMYVYLGKDVSNLSAIVLEISELDANQSSPVHLLKKYLEDGFVIGLQNEVLEVLNYAYSFISTKSIVLGAQKRHRLMLGIENVIESLLSHKLTIDNKSVLNGFQNGGLKRGGSNFADQDAALMEITIDEHDGFVGEYRSSLSLPEVVGFETLFGNPASLYVAADTGSTVVSATTDRTNSAGLVLASDTAATFGAGTTAFRGWTINKNATTAELSFDYQNTDTVGQVAVPEYTVMQIDGLNNELQLPTAGTKLVFDVDTNLYRDSANVLKTDDSFVVGGSYLSFVDGSVSGTLSVADAIINDITVTGGTLSVTDAIVQNATITTLSATDEVIGTSLTILPFSTAGVVHNNASGLLSSSLIVNADVSPSAAIVDTKLATIATAGKVSNSATTATSTNTPSTIVLRDASGDFSAGTITASLTGSASNNVLKAGDTMTGALNMATQNEVRFQDAAGGQYVGINAPATVPTSYTVSLPSDAPTAHQVLRANSATPTNLEWASEGGSALPAVSETIYVAKYGNDTSGDGSFSNPYLTLAKAIDIANSLSSASNPVAIDMNSGVYVEDNSLGALAITVAGVSIIGNSVASVIISPSTPANDLITANNSLRMANVTLKSAGSTATGLVLTTGALSTFNNMRILNFQTGVACSGGAANSYGFSSCLFSDNGTAIDVSSARLELNVCSVFGVGSLAGPAANTGISITGAGSGVLVSGGVIGVCDTGVNMTGNSLVTLNGVSFKLNKFDLVQNGASHLLASSCSFDLTDGTGDVDVAISGAGTIAELVGCQFNGKSTLGVARGVGLAVSDEAFVIVSGGTMSNYATGIHAGISTDVFSTELDVSAFVISNCTTDILQEGTTTLRFNASTATSAKISLNDSTNVELAFFDLDDNGALTIGSFANQNTILLQPAIDAANNPSFEYESSVYSTQGIGFENLFGNPSSIFVEANADAKFIAGTTIRTDVAGVRLVSDTGSPFGGTSALRGWDINKNGTSAELSFGYQNSDIVGQSAISPYTVMQLDGVNNQLQLPTAGAQIVFAGDTNLYRSAASVLKTDDNFIVGTLTAGRAVQTNSGTNQLESSAVTNTELGYLSGVTGSIQTQLNGKVAKAGDIMTGTLQLPAGTTALPSLVFTGSTTTGLSVNSNNISFSNAGSESMKIASTGVVSIDAFITSGVVHNDSSGNLSSSLIVDADITNATISNSKLATIASGNTAGAIVVRDGSGNFSTNMITLSGTVTNPTDAATKSYVDAVVATGLSPKAPANALADSNITLSGSQTIDGVSLVATDRVLLVNQTDPIENGLWEVQVGAWNRPADFFTGNPAGQAYVVILAGTVYQGSSWICDTPQATIGTDPISFVLFTLPDQTTGANVGTGTGLVYQGKTGVTLNFRSLLAGSHLTFTTNTNDVTATTDATSANTASTIVARDASGDFSAGTITASLTGAASANVLKAGDTMTGSLTLPVGTTLAPSLNFTGSTTTGLSVATADTLSFSTAATERMKISSTGTVSIDQFTTAGVVHNDSSGNLSSSLIVNADVDPAAAIVDTKLATISTAGKVSNSATTATSANTPNTIVLRDGSGNFNAGTIVASLTGSASNNVLKAGDTMTGALQLPAGTVVAPSLVFTGSTTTGLSANTDDLSFSTTGVERMKISAGGVVSIDSFITAGVVHNDSSGDLSSSLIVNADVDPAAAIVDTKLATINTAGKVANSATTATSANVGSAIVTRDVSGNFSANAVSFTDAVIGDLTVTNCISNLCVLDLSVVDGSVSGTLSVNDAVINNLTINAGDISVTDAIITNATITNLSSTDAVIADLTVTNCIANLCVLDLSVVDGSVSGALSVADEVVNTSLTITPFSTAGVVHNNASGLLSSSLIVNADVSASAAIVDTKLATISTAGKVSNSATTAISTDTPSTIVLRDGSGNFATNMITIDGTVTNPTDVATKNYVDTAIGATGTNLNTPNTLVRRDGTGSFAAQTISLVDEVVSGNISLADSTSATVGNINKAGTRFIHNFGTNNTFVGKSAGNFTTSGTGNNVGIGVNSLVANTTGANNTAVGSSSLQANTVGIQNTAVGYLALGANSAGINNTALGYSALSSNTTGSRNIAIGASALSANTVGTQNIGIGVSALLNNTTGVNNIALGDSALGLNTIGLENVGIGVNALAANTTGIENTAVGFDALQSNTIGVENVAVGYLALNANIDGGSNTAIGGRALAANTTGGLLTAIGNRALAANTTGEGNTAIGGRALAANTIGVYNTAVGGDALTANITGGENTAVGASALQENTIGVYNTAVGSSALLANTTGTSNTAVGANALLANTTGISNTVVGASAGALIETGANNVMLGYNIGTSTVTGSNNIYIDGNGLSPADESNTIRIGNSQTNAYVKGIYGVTVGSSQVVTVDSSGHLGSSTFAAAGTPLNTPNTLVARDNTGSFAAQTISLVDEVVSGNISLSDSTSASVGNINKAGTRFIHNFGTDNTFVGKGAGNFTTSGSGSVTAVGASALAANTTGFNNTAVGSFALFSNTTAIRNTAVGASSLQSNTTGGNNTAIGNSALLLNTTGSDNTAVGNSALQANATGRFNTAIGSSALSSNTEGSNNTAVGYLALGANTTGIQNTVVGRNAGAAVTTGTTNLMLGYNVGGSTTTGSNNIYIDGNGLSPANESNTIRIGNTQTTSYLQGIFGVTVTGGTAVFVKSDGQLGTTTSSKKFKHSITSLADTSEKIYDLNPVSFVYNSDETSAIQYGLIAEEVDQVFPALVVKDSEGMPYTVRYDVLPVLLLNEIQKQKREMQEQKDDINCLIRAVNSLQQEVHKFVNA